MLCAMSKAHAFVLATAAAGLVSATLVVRAQDVPEAALSCITDGTKVGHTYIHHADPAKLKVAAQLFEAQTQNADYPEGTVIRAIPQEAMIKRSKSAFPNTNGWEYVALTVTPQGASVRERGDAASGKYLQTNVVGIGIDLSALGE